MEDCYWDTGSDLGHLDFIKPVYRLDMWMRGYHPDATDMDGFSPYKTFGNIFTSFDDYLEKFEAEVAARRENIVGFKCAQAYQRVIRFDHVDYETAKAIFGKDLNTISIEEQNQFGDYIFHRAMLLAEKYDLPVQFHTGLAKLQGSNPMYLEGVISSYPKIRFVLFHGGFPWIYETAGLAHNFQNIILDINWLPLISTTASYSALQTYLDVLRDSNWITWGADTWTSEEGVGASMAFRHVLARVLSDRVDQGIYSLKHAETFAEKIMYKNAAHIYGSK